jgi:hypothetical protein
MVCPKGALIGIGLIIPEKQSTAHDSCNIFFSKFQKELFKKSL